LERHCRNRFVRILPAALAVLLAACGGGAPDDEEGGPAQVPTIVAETAAVKRQTVLEELLVHGTIAAVPNADVKVSALVPGRVMKVGVAEGDAVREGQVLATIDPAPLQDERREAAASLEQAKATLQNAQSNLQRTQQLFDKGVAAGKEVEDARRDLAAAEAGLEQTSAVLDRATRQVARAEVRSPLSGQVIRRMVNGGEQVDGTPAQPIVEVANLNQVELAANVPSSSMARVAPGQPVGVSSDAYPERVFTGSVLTVAPAVDPSTSAALVRIRIPNPDRALKIGMFADARIQLSAHANAVVVPPSALVRTQGGAASVYVVSDDLAQRTDVQVGLETREAVEILTGVKDGQVVLTSGAYGLGEKAKITRPGSASSDSEKPDSEQSGSPGSEPKK
jgi:membrane fusion protein, multidrug efflux system